MNRVLFCHRSSLVVKRQKIVIWQLIAIVLLEPINTHLVVSESQETWGSAAQTSTFSMITKLLTEEQILFQQDAIKESEPHKRNKWKGRLQQCSCGAGKQLKCFTMTWVI